MVVSEAMDKASTEKQVDADFYESWAAEESEAFAVREQVNKHLAERKAKRKDDVEKKSEDQS